MTNFTYTITDKLGIHARPAGLLVQEAKKFTSDITLKHEEKTIDLKHLFKLMGIRVKQGQDVEITCNGNDEQEAAMALREFLQSHL
jgi:phosphocarrier protein